MQLQKGSDRKQGAVTRETGGKAFVISFLLDEPVFTSKEEVKGRPQEKDSQKLRMFLRSGAQHIYPERELVDCPSAYPTGAKAGPDSHHTAPGSSSPRALSGHQSPVCLHMYRSGRD